MKERLSKHRSAILVSLLAPLQKKLKGLRDDLDIGSLSELNIIPKAPKLTETEELSAAIIQRKGFLRNCMETDVNF